MEIYLDGVNKTDRNELSNIIINEIKSVFGQADTNIKEISIPSDFVEIVNRKYTRIRPGERYIYGNQTSTPARTFRVNNKCEIVLNSQYYNKDKEYFLSTIYHEIVHAKFYNDISKNEYSNIREEKRDNEDDLINVFTLKVIDEYNAYKKTFEKYPNIRDKYYLSYSIKLDTYIRDLEAQNFDWFTNFIDYLNKVTTSLSIVLAIWSTDKSKENEVLLQKCDVEELYQLLGNNEIPSDDNFSTIKKVVNKIVYWIPWND